MKSIQDNRTTRSIGNNPTLTPMATNPKGILQTASSLSFRMMYKNSGSETQEWEDIVILEQALAINDKGLLQDPVPANTTAHTPLASQKLRAVIQEMAK